MRLEGFSGIITATFTDRMDINRYIDKTNPDGTTETALSDSPIYSDVECRLSFRSEESPQDGTVDNTPVQTSPKIFFKTGADVRAGDYITVYRKDSDGNVVATYSGNVGLPSVYATHKEALFIIKESA